MPWPQLEYASDAQGWMDVDVLSCSELVFVRTLMRKEEQAPRSSQKVGYERELQHVQLVHAWSPQSQDKKVCAAQRAASATWQP